MSDRLNTPPARWDGHCCPNDPRCDHSLMDDDEFDRWMSTPLTDEQAEELVR